jgi:hypothetical protein
MLEALSSHKNTFKLAIIYTIVITSIFTLSCSSSSPSQLSEPDNILTGKERIYECAANGLYALCRKSGISISYKDCLELLPPAPIGNSMLEFKAALMSLGFHVEAQRLTIDELTSIQLPAVILVFTLDSMELSTVKPPPGHYFVLWPLDEHSVEVLYYPREPAVVSWNHWARFLHSVGDETIPSLLCSAP